MSEVTISKKELTSANGNPFTYIAGETRGMKISLNKSSVVSSLWLQVYGEGTVYGRVYDESGTLVAQDSKGTTVNKTWKFWEMVLDEPLQFIEGQKYLVSFYFTNSMSADYNTALTVGSNHGIVYSTDGLGMYQVERSDSVPFRPFLSGLYNMSIGLTIAPIPPTELRVPLVSGVVSGDTAISWGESSTAVTTTTPSQLQYEVELSTDGGTTWEDIVALTNPRTTTVNFNFANKTFSRRAYVRVRAYDPNQKALSGWRTSNAFTINRPPAAPMPVTPVSTDKVKPAVVVTLTPTLRWGFTDPDAGNTETAYQVQVYDASNNTLVWDSNKRPIADFVAVPSSANLMWDTLYFWRVKTWDNAETESSFSVNQYFIASHVPDVTQLRPGSNSAATPEATRVNPRLEWTYGDPDNNSQTRFQVILIDAGTGTVKHDSGILLSADSFYDVPGKMLESGKIYKWRVTVWDSKDLSQTADERYIRTNALPDTLTLILPLHNQRTKVRPTFVAQIGDDSEDNGQNFLIQVSESEDFKINLREYRTSESVVGWEVHNGTSWLAFPVGGVDSTFEGKLLRFHWPEDLQEKKTYYWRMAPIEVTSGLLGNWSEVRRMRAGHKLQFELLKPMKTTIAAEKLVMSGVYKVPADGQNPASLLVEVCNNAYDAVPAWEDATEAFRGGLYHKFANRRKSAENWGINVRVTVTANDSMNPIEFDGFGFAFI